MISLDKSPKAVPYIFIALLAVIAFGATLRVGFLWDDHEMIEANPAIRSIHVETIARAFQGDVFNGKGDPYFRPVETLWNMADYALWGPNPYPFHVVNLILFILTCFLLFVCLRRILEDDVMALFAALFMAVHPIVVEQLLIVAGRAEILSTLFTLAALVLAFEGSWAAYGGSLFCFLVACLSKESGITMPLYLALAGWYNPRLRQPIRRYIGYALVGVIYLYLRSRAVSSAGLLPRFLDLMAFSVRDFPMIVVRYLRILFFPVDLHSHRRMAFHRPWMFLAPALLLGAIGGCIAKRWRLGLFAAGWFLLGLAPKVPLLATNSLMLDHWVFFAAAGIYVLISALLTKLLGVSRTRPLGLGLLLIIIGFWVGYAQLNIAGRNTDFKMYTWALRYPTSSHVRTNLGVLYYQNGAYDRALTLFEDALRMSPDGPMAINGKALCLWRLGRPEDAIAILTEAIKRYPQYLLFQKNLALIQSNKDASRMRHPSRS